MKRKIFLVFIVVILAGFHSLEAETVFWESFSGPYPGAWSINSNYSMGWAWPYGYAYIYSAPSGPAYPYPNNLAVRMQRGSINLSGYSRANLSFYYSVDTQPNYDYLSVRVRDVYTGLNLEVFRASGRYGSGWYYRSIDISQFAGRYGVFIEFYFYSNASICGQDYGFSGVRIDNVLLTAERDTITVTSPNGGETLMTGSTSSITWNSTGNISYVIIELSTDNGTTWSTIISSTPNDGQYSWTVPDTPSTQCLVRIRDAYDGNPSDTGDAVFSIVKTPAIQVTSPNGGENWMTGAAHDITWQSEGTVGDVSIELSTDNGTTWSAIISSTPNDGQYSWTVPDTPSTQCLVRIKEASDGSPSDTGDAAFSIVKTPTIQITSPNGGESWMVGTVQNITWQSEGTVGDVSIELSTDNGTTWSTIISSTPNDGQYSWTVPDTPSTQCLVRIKEASDGSPSDAGDAAFSIVKTPTINIISPNGGESWMVGTAHNITWQSEGTVGDVSIELSTDNGTTWSTIISSTSNDGQYSWTVPDTPSTQCLVRIKEASDASPSDTGDAAFSITRTPTIQITSPNGGESWMTGTAHNITWQSEGTVGDVSIELSTDNGTTWSAIISSTPNDGQYSWTVPDTPSTQCLVRIKEASGGSPSDTGDAAFSITRTPTIQITSPNGSESWEVGSAHSITWDSTGNVGDVSIELSTDNGTTWSAITPSPTPNDGEYSWTVSNTPSARCLVRIKEASDGAPSDTSDATFSIVSVETPTITVTSPNGGESWKVGSTRSITWSSSDTVGNVKIEYSTDNGSSWTTIVYSTTNDGTYSWEIPDTSSHRCLVKISEVSHGSVYDTGDAVFSITPNVPPEILLNRGRLNFGADTDGTVTDPQVFLIENNGGGTLTWNVSDNVDWFDISPNAGTGSSIVTVYVNPSGLLPGIYNGIITVSAPDAVNSPQTINVMLNVFKPENDEFPFGTFETPQDGTTVRSSVPVTGWVLDDIQVEKVEIWGKNLAIYPGGNEYWEDFYIGDALFVEGARPDVELAYPDYPMNYQAGWGYMMLTNFLPNQGNGTFIIYTKAVDKTGKQVILGEKTIYCDNNNAKKPFGAIDTPAQGGTASGSSFINWGWVLTPQPNRIPADGSTINVFVDGVNLGHPTYNIYRPDITGLFPGYANSDRAIGYFYLDTTAYKNGIHTIQWTASDSAGNFDGIGSRYFSIRNVGGTGAQAPRGMAQRPQWPGNSQYKSIKQLSEIPIDFVEPVRVKKGFKGDNPRVILPDENGVINIEIRELERIAVQLFDNPSDDSKIVGRLNVGNRLRALPIGSSLDTRDAIFYWQPGPGFLGEYNFIFIEKGRNVLKRIKVTIFPRY